MTEYRLSSDIYTEQAVAEGIKAFAHLCTATSYPAGDYTILRIDGTDDMLHAELLNYILALSAQTILQQ